MTKSQAALALEVSEKTVSRYVAAGRLPARYVSGKTGRQLEIAAADVQTLQLELRRGTPAAVVASEEGALGEVAPMAAIDMDGAAPQLSDAIDEPDIAPLNAAPLNAAPLTSIGSAPQSTGQNTEQSAALAMPSPSLTLSALARIVRAVMDEAEAEQNAGAGQLKLDKARVPIESKLLLSLDEAAALSGVPRAHLDAARRQGQLGARKIGRALKVRRDELEGWVAALWDA